MVWNEIVGVTAQPVLGRERKVRRRTPGEYRYRTISYCFKYGSVADFRFGSIRHRVFLGSVAIAQSRSNLTFLDHAREPRS
jgi:hypothetical protein